MNQATKEAVATIAALPEKERKQALAVAKAAGKICELAQDGQSINLNDCSIYRGCRNYQGKEVTEEILSLMGIEIKGGEGGRGNKLTASLKKI